jgi:hypothetical protein
MEGSDESEMLVLWKDLCRDIKKLDTQAQDLPADLCR